MCSSDVSLHFPVGTPLLHTSVLAHCASHAAQGHTVMSEDVTNALILCNVGKTHSCSRTHDSELIYPFKVKTNKQANKQMKWKPFPTKKSKW